MSKPTANGGWAPEVTEDLKDRMRSLVEQGFKSVSRRYRTIVRVPDEFVGKARKFEKWCLDQYWELSKEKYRGQPLGSRMPARAVEAFYCRVYSCYPFMVQYVKELSIDEYAAFRKAGGDSW